MNEETKVNYSAFIRFTPSSLAVSIVALRDIEPGEEINITCKLKRPFLYYGVGNTTDKTFAEPIIDVPLGKTREERQADLQKWGFNCTCSLCTASKAEVAASDYRRSKIKDMRQEVMKAVEAWDGTKAVKLTHEVLELMRAEDLAPLYASQYEIMARLYWKARDKKTGAKYAKMSIDTLVDQGYLEDSPGALPALLKSFDD